MGWASELAADTRVSYRPGVSCEPDLQDRFVFEREWVARGMTRIAGVDEAGRGPLAGPVIAAAVMFPPEWVRDGLPEALRGLNDSKQVPASRRDTYHRVLTGTPGLVWGLGVVEADEIDRINILRATHAAMVRALASLATPPDHVLVDGLAVDEIRVSQTALVKGDGRSYSIAAASILAKVTRDRRMVEHDRSWPGYGFAIHKGYPTAAHLASLKRLGPCPIHRRSFGPVASVERVAELFGR